MKAYCAGDIETLRMQKYFIQGLVVGSVKG